MLITVTKNNPCPTGIEVYQNNSGFLIYPIPVLDLLNIESKQKTDFITSINLYSLNGILLLKKESVSDNKTLLDISRIPSGFYLLKITTYNNHVTYEKILKF